MMNWANLIGDLLQRGYTFESISRELGTIKGPGVRAMMRVQGQQPRWHTGDALIRLHTKVMRAARKA